MNNIDYEAHKIGDFFTSDSQKVIREQAQKYINDLQTMGVSVGFVKILGNWHSVHHGTILKAPVPWNYENDRDKKILDWLEW